MKISISYPPLESNKGVPLLAQNRQFQWFKDPTYIYPMIPAYTATLLKENGYDVIWDDAIAEGLSYGKWIYRIRNEKINLLVLETKTPVIKRHWKIISHIKEIDENIKIVLVGDHVTAYPEESFENSKVDFVLQGGDYDFGILNLVNWLYEKEEIKKGWWRRNNSTVIKSDIQDLNQNNLNELPFIDRELTNWKLYAYKNGP